MLHPSLLTLNAFLPHDCVCSSQDDGLDGLVRRVHQHHPDCSLMVATWGLQVRFVMYAACMLQQATPASRSTGLGAKTVGCHPVDAE